jgi:hypothetical protein
VDAAERAADRAAGRDRARQTLELRNALTVVMGRAQLLKKRALPLDRRVASSRAIRPTPRTFAGSGDARPETVPAVAIWPRHYRGAHAARGQQAVNSP